MDTNAATDTVSHTYNVTFSEADPKRLPVCFADSHRFSLRVSFAYYDVAADADSEHNADQ